LKNYRLIAIDMDGTLLNNDLEISPRVINAIQEVRRRGTQVTICTGRMFASAKPYADQMGLNVPLITYNGALVKNSQTEEILYERSVPLDEARKVINKCRKYGFTLNVYINDELFVDRITPEAERYAERVGVTLNKVDDLEELLNQGTQGLNKMLAIGDEEKLNKMRREMVEEGSKLYITRSLHYFLEFLNQEATKGLGLKAVAETLGIKREETMAIGDNENDLEMFKYAGAAVVMGNARDEVKSYADYVTSSNDDDGVAEAIEKLVLGK